MLEGKASEKFSSLELKENELASNSALSLSVVAGLLSWSRRTVEILEVLLPLIFLIFFQIWSVGVCASSEKTKSCHEALLDCLRFLLAIARHFL